MIEDRHRDLKRWERATQLSGIESELVLSGPLAWCLVHGQPGTAPEKIRVYILKIFAKDFVCVRAHIEPIPASLLKPIWLERGGIEWPAYLKEIVTHYRLGLPVPSDFEPVKKMGIDLVMQLEMNAVEDLPVVFQKMREANLLPTLPTLSKTACPPELPWENLKAFFQDFSGSG